MNPELTIIMALYNTLPYLKKCTDSILSQSYSNFELVVVDNRSDDGSYEFMKALSTKDSRIRLHRREQHGNASTSREIGRQMACGSFITYVDSDDSIKPGMYERLMGCVKAQEADIAVCNYDVIYPDKVLNGYCDMRDEVIELTECGYETYFYRYFCASPPNNYLWTRVVRRELFERKGIYVPDVEITEDTIFTMLCTSVADRVVHLSESYYNYYQREDSSVRELVRNDDVAIRYVQAFEKMVAMVRSLGLEERFYRILPFYAYTRIRSILFYKGLVQMSPAQDFSLIKETIAGSSLPKYLQKALEPDALTSYGRIHGEPAVEEIRRIILKCL